MEHEDIANTMAENGRQFVLDNFAWDVITKKYLDFFEGLRR